MIQKSAVLNLPYSFYSHCGLADGQLMAKCSVPCWCFSSYVHNNSCAVPLQ